MSATRHFDYLVEDETQKFFGGVTEDIAKEDMVKTAANIGDLVRIANMGLREATKIPSAVTKKPKIKRLAKFGSDVSAELVLLAIKGESYGHFGMTKAASDLLAELEMEPGNSEADLDMAYDIILGSSLKHDLSENNDLLKKAGVSDQEILDLNKEILVKAAGLGSKIMQGARAVFGKGRLPVVPLTGEAAAAAEGKQIFRDFKPPSSVSEISPITSRPAARLGNVGAQAKGLYAGAKAAVTNPGSPLRSARAARAQLLGDHAAKQTDALLAGKRLREAAAKSTSSAGKEVGETAAAAKLTAEAKRSAAAAEKNLGTVDKLKADAARVPGEAPKPAETKVPGETVKEPPPEHATPGGATKAETATGPEHGPAEPGLLDSMKKLWGGTPWAQLSDKERSKLIKAGVGAYVGKKLLLDSSE